MVSNTWTRENLAWVGGLFEGEGNISFRNQTRASMQTLVGVGSSDEDTIHKIYAIVGLGRVYGPYAKGNHKPMWYWKIGRRDHAYAFLAAIFPWLCSRRQARAKEFFSAYTPTLSPSESTQRARIARWAFKHHKG